MLITELLLLLLLQTLGRFNEVFKFFGNTTSVNSSASSWTQYNNTLNKFCGLTWSEVYISTVMCVTHAHYNCIMDFWLGPSRDLVCIIEVGPMYLLHGSSYSCNTFTPQIKGTAQATFRM